MSGVLYVTSFAKDMYMASGRKMIQTFKKFNPNDKLVVCYEKMNFTDPNPKIIPYNLGESEFLHNWLRDNRDVIPFYLGGAATPQNNPELLKNEFNRQASRFFRKIVSIDYAIKTYGKKYQYVVWVDADAYFIKTIPIKLFDIIFGDNHVFFHLGPKRERAGLGIESGIFGFRKGNGYRYFKRVANRFRDGSFRQYPKWDDGFVFRKVWEEEVEANKTRQLSEVIKFRDVVSHLVKSSRNEVTPYGPFKDHIVHEKGKHKKMKIRI